MSKAKVVFGAAVAIAASATIPDNYVLVPGGYMHSSCVHKVESGMVLDEAMLPLCAHPFLRRGKVANANATHGSAWKAWAQWSGPVGATTVTNLVSTWAVPSTPTQQGNGVTLFWWNGVEPADTSAVLQPVLQYGSSAAGGGDYWAYASWYVSSAHGSHFSTVETVQSGDIVTGNNTVLPDGTWVISATAPGRTDSILKFKPVAGDWGTAYHVLEAYGVTTNCDVYPQTPAGPGQGTSSVNFTNVAVSFNGKATAPIPWQFMTQTAGCNEHAAANTAGDEVSIVVNCA